MSNVARGEADKPQVGRIVDPQCGHPGRRLKGYYSFSDGTDVLRQELAVTRMDVGPADITGRPQSSFFTLVSSELPAPVGCCAPNRRGDGRQESDLRGISSSSHASLSATIALT